MSFFPLRGRRPPAEPQPKRRQPAPSAPPQDRLPAALAERVLAARARRSEQARHFSRRGEALPPVLNAEEVDLAVAVCTHCRCSFDVGKRLILGPAARTGGDELYVGQRDLGLLVYSKRDSGDLYFGPPVG